jgi:hypothetical protein
MDKKTAEKLVNELVKAEYTRYKAYVDAYKLRQGHNPSRDWIKIRLTMDEAAALIGE